MGGALRPPAVGGVSLWCVFTAKLSHICHQGYGEGGRGGGGVLQEPAACIEGGLCPPPCQRFLPVSPHLTHLKIGVIGSLALPLAGKRPPSAIVCFPPEDAFDECAPPHFLFLFLRGRRLVVMSELSSGTETLGINKQGTQSLVPATGPQSE